MDLISREETMTAFTNEYELYQDDVNLICKIPSAFEGMTNGEVLQKIITGLKPIVLSGETGAIYFDWDWWNAPYKGVSE